MVVCEHVREVDYSVGHLGSLYIQVLNGPEADSFFDFKQKVAWVWLLYGFGFRIWSLEIKEVPWFNKDIEF